MTNMNEKRTWDDIPNIENLEIDWDFVPENPLGKREHVRVTARDLYRLFQETEYPVNIKSGNINIEGTLVDISEGWISIKSDIELMQDQEVNIDLILGNKSIVASGIVKMVREQNWVYFLGVQFTSITKKLQAFIKEMYPSAKILR